MNEDVRSLKEEKAKASGLGIRKPKPEYPRENELIFLWNLGISYTKKGVITTFSVCFSVSFERHGDTVG